MSSNVFRFFLSCDINLPVTFRVERLEGALPSTKSPNSEERKPELYVECALYIDGAPFGLLTRTRLESMGPSYCWNELITLSTKYRDLTAHSQLALTVWDFSCEKDEGLVGGATVLLFGSKMQLKTGKQKLRLLPGKEADGSLPTTTPGKESGANFLLPPPITSTNELVTVWDPEVGKINPSEHKQVKLARSLTRGIINRDLKPSSNERKSIQRILKYPPTRTLSGDEKQLLWKFRFSLMSEKRALTKFLRSVEWSDVQEAKQALELIGKWEVIDVYDILELLSPVFESEEVRACAVSILERADDEELQCYLLQLVQALRFERSDKSP